MTEVQTVTGKISGSELGVTLPHEHIFIDFSCALMKPTNPEYEWVVDTKVTLNVFGTLMHHAYLCKDNMLLDSPEVAMEELKRFKAIGGRTVVDMTNRGLSPRPLQLRELSRKTGLNIVAGCGYYIFSSHPPDMGTRTVEQLAEEMIRDITVGIDGTKVKAGVIGEIGTSHPIAENEKKVLRAAAQAQINTGLSINVHITNRGNHGPEAVRFLESEGVDPARIIISHMDEVQDPFLRDQKAVADAGAYVEFDCFGEEDYVEEDDSAHPRDTERVTRLKQLIDWGYIDKLLLSHDVCQKIYTRTYGGYGYDHIHRSILPMLRRIGVTETEINLMIVENPRRAISH